ncbi:GNAT family N-acetyltransferase [Hymenobacter taeanensis]|uniref:GNAT family N-acetyltransferase n=1 Tax=Hymenobacter taeanensis TaxID=2735321 RepID=A0A6M6BH63_9BACT|nr:MULTISPECIES: GNAT family N-acetyltransferase [Hymenobacter]QJX47901.1 GNAT family N-acetyltransferase [Hymenobacter taeanensis]UOQ82657.1 GNAT family N-acetyltransferase [Hymenobacter sp. 5414T-23]
MTHPLSLLPAPSAVVPQLETPDLLLRGPRITDLPEFASMAADPDFYRYVGAKPQTEEDAWRRLLAQQGHWTLLGYGAWSVEEKATGRFIGTVGFFDFQRDLTPSIKGTLEAGWALAPRIHGRGYASQAVEAALQWADAHFPTARMTCIIDPDNVASLKVASKFGFQEIARTTYHDGPVLLLERSKGNK